MMRRWTLTYPARPWSLNAERKAGHWSERDALVREWREAFGWLARAQRIPPLARVTIHAEVTMRLPLQDTANAYPAVKAALDGIVDAGVLPDDGPAHVARICLDAPLPGDDLFTLTIMETQ